MESEQSSQLGSHVSVTALWVCSVLTRRLSSLWDDSLPTAEVFGVCVTHRCKKQTWRFGFEQQRQG